MLQNRWRWRPITNLLFKKVYTQIHTFLSHYNKLEWKIFLLVLSSLFSSFFLFAQIVLLSLSACLYFIFFLACHVSCFFLHTSYSSWNASLIASDNAVSFFEMMMLCFWWWLWWDFTNHIKLHCCTKLHWMNTSVFLLSLKIVV